VLNVGPAASELDLIATTGSYVYTGTAAQSSISWTGLFGDFEDGNYLINPLGSQYYTQYLWNQYPSGDFGGDDESGTITFINTDSVINDYCIDDEVDSDDGVGAAYLQFYPQQEDGGLAHWYWLHEIVEDFLNLGRWRWDHYNRLEFYVKSPSELSQASGGQPNFLIGTYHRDQNEATTEHESDNLHYYHQYNIVANGHWTKVIWDMHPSHQRDESGNTEQDNQPYPTNESGINYFDCLTRFYLDFYQSYVSSNPATWLFDGFRIYHEPNTEDEVYTYSLAGTFESETDELSVCWSKDKDETGDHYLRYAFSDIHALGWSNATVCPNGTVSPQGSGGYNINLYQTTSINMGSNDSIFIAIQYDGQSLFKQIEIPLNI